MSVLVKKALVAVLVLMPMMTTSAVADEQALLERIQRLERIVKGQGLVSLLGRVDRLQNEVQRLNGDNETLRHELTKMKEQQRQMYLDLDQRLSAKASTPAVETANTTNDSVTDLVETPQETGVAEQAEVTQQVVEPGVEAGAPQQQNDVEAAPAAVENGEAAYQAALQTLRSGQYGQAITELTAFPEQYPQSSYLPNTYYWRGEANYVLRNFEAAITAFQTVIDKFPLSNKVADATLKLGFSQYEMGKVDQATTTLNKTIELFPNSSAARLAKVKLDRINKQSR